MMRATLRWKNTATRQENRHRRWAGFGGGFGMDFGRLKLEQFHLLEPAGDHREKQSVRAGFFFR